MSNEAKKLETKLNWIILTFSMIIVAVVVTSCNI